MFSSVNISSAAISFSFSVLRIALFEREKAQFA
jgi:hypothetical protein